jgi:ATP-dependent DNA helicase HFM1/MER3
MDEGVYEVHDPLDGRGERRPSQQQYSLLQPRYTQPPRPVQPRDRYRAPRHEPRYDRVEDDEYGYDVPLDSFGKGRDVSEHGARTDESLDERLDKRLTQQSYAPPQQQAVIRHTRLSFPPQTSKFHAASAVSQPRPSYCVHDAAAYDLGGE